MKRTARSKPTALAQPDSTRWLEAFAAMTALIGVGGLIALMSQGAWAQTPPPAAAPPGSGLESGSRPFGKNPFTAQTPPPGGGKGESDEGFFADDEFEDEVGDADEEFETGTPPGGRAATPPGGRGNPAPSANVTNKGISAGGTPPGGVIPGENTPAPINLDEDSAEGGKEIVTDFNFPDADIMDIAKTLGKLTGKNFIFDKDVKGRVSIISNSPITVGDAWRAFLTALDMNQFALIPSGKYIRIARQRDARDKQLRTYVGDYSPNTDALITRVFPLKYLSADEVARNFRSFMPANSRIIPYDQTNTVIVTDTGANIAKLSKLLEILDVEGYDAGIEVIPVKFASAAELSKLIDTLIPGTQAAGPGGAGPRFGGGRGFTARRTKEGGIINTIIADERTNTLIVHANTRGADQVRELVAKLDQKLPANTGGGRVRVVYLQFADAEAIAQTLNNLSSQAGGGFKAVPAAGGGTGSNPVQASLFEGSIKISADKATNSLVITASPTDFVTIQQVINRLDIPRDEVYVETIIMEMALNRDFRFSTNIALPNQGIFLAPNQDLVEFITNPIAQRGLVLGLQSTEKREFTVNNTKVQVPNLAGLIKLLQTNNQANVLATPQILTLDNTEATFEQAEKIPVLTTTAVNGAVANSTTTQNVALSIKIKPQINKISNFVKMDITAKLADISNRELPAQLQTLAFATTERTAQTSVVVADGDTVVLGGLIRDAESETNSKVPILGDIPLLGWLFKSRNTTTQKSNLMIFMTPHIVRQYEKVRALLDKKLKERDDFIESAAGGKDVHRRHRDNLIRSLPDISEIKAKSRPPKVESLDGAPAAVPVEPDNSKPAPKKESTETPGSNDPFTGASNESNPAPAPVQGG